MRDINNIYSSKDFSAFQELITGSELANSLFPGGCDDSLLCEAAARGLIRFVGLLIDNGANINYANSDGFTPLHFATLGDHLQVAEKLLSSGGNVNQDDVSYSTPLHRAADLGYVELVELLINNNANVLHCDAGGDTPIHSAISRGRENVIAKFLTFLDIKDLKKTCKAPYLHSSGLLFISRLTQEYKWDTAENIVTYILQYSDQKPIKIINMLIDERQSVEYSDVFRAGGSGLGL